MTDEIYIQVIEFPNYYISNLGNLKNRHGRIMKRNLDSDGYFIFTPLKKGKQTTKKIHRLVAQAFIPNPENKPQVNHINGIKTDNRIENLEWATPLENSQHAIKIGIYSNAGEGNPSSKLRNKDINFIRKSFLSNRKLAKMFNVSDVSIGNIINRKTWKHI